MSNASPLAAALIAFAAAVSTVALAPSPAASALMIKGIFGNKALRIVVDKDMAEAEVTFGDSVHVVDLDSGKAHLVAADGTLRPAEMEAGEAAPRPKIEAWGPGPSIAGHPSVYHVMRLDDELCGELLLSPWMKPFVDPAVQALAILERIKGEVEIRKTGLDGACAELPFSSYALAGWPLMAGSMDAPIFRTEAIEFDYQPSGDEFKRPN